MKTSKKLCIFLFLHDLFPVCGFSQGAPHLVLYMWVNHNIAYDSVDGSYQFGIQDSNGPCALVQR
jgi:hypothetical protein